MNKASSYILASGIICSLICLSSNRASTNTPCFSADVMTGLARWKKPREQMIFILCGAAGLRIGETLGIEIDKHISPDFLTLYVKQKVHHGKVEERLKTANGFSSG